QPTLAGGEDAFFAKLSTGGETLQYSTYFGGALNDRAQGIAVDSVGTVAVTGYTESSNFVIFNQLQGLPGGLRDAFLAKIADSGLETVVPVTILTNPDGLAYSVDGVVYTAGATLYWTPGASH